MLILNPRTITFASTTWDGISSIAIDRLATRAAVSWSDGGPHATFADAPEQKTILRITRDLLRDDLDVPRPGDSGTLTFVTSPAAADSHRRRLTCTAVVLSVTHSLSLTRGATRTIEFIALSTDGAQDPITITDAGATP